MGIQSVQVFGRKKAATAVAYCKQGRGLLKVNGCPIELLEPEILRLKTFEPVLLLGQTRFANVDIRIRVKGGGFTAQIYAIRQAIAKSSSRITRNTSTRPQKRRSGTSSCSTTARCSWRTPEGASRRSSAARPRARATRSRTAS